MNAYLGISLADYTSRIERLLISFQILKEKVQILASDSVDDRKGTGD